MALSCERNSILKWIMLYSERQRVVTILHMLLYAIVARTIVTLYLNELCLEHLILA